jgi:predicted P-loop ATPase
VRKVTAEEIAAKKASAGAKPEVAPKRTSKPMSSDEPHPYELANRIPTVEVCSAFGLGSGKKITCPVCRNVGDWTNGGGLGFKCFHATCRQFSADNLGLAATILGLGETKGASEAAKASRRAAYSALRDKFSTLPALIPTAKERAARAREKLPGMDVEDEEDAAWGEFANETAPAEAGEKTTAEDAKPTVGGPLATEGNGAQRKARSSSKNEKLEPDLPKIREWLALLLDLPVDERELELDRILRIYKTTKTVLRATMHDLDLERRRANTPGETPEWVGELSCTLEGTPRGSIPNALLVLANDAPWENVIAYDEFAEASVFRRAPPWDAEAKSGQPFREGGHVEEEDAARLVTWLDRHWQVRISTAMAHEVIEVIARRNSFHPVVEWLKSLKWDGVERVAGKTEPGWLTRYAGAEDTPYHRHVGRWVLCGAVERVLKPGSKCDTMLILEGEQGKKKSTFFNALFGDAWFSDTLSEIGSKDAYQDLRGKWCIEMSELDQLNRVEATTAKKFIAKKFDNYRPSYGRRNRDVPRQCIFVGSTNADEYLKDWTGNRRYWPVRCGPKDLDIEGIVRDRDQLFSEAFHLREQGVRWWPEGDEVALCEAEQEQRRQRDPWEAIFIRKLNEAAINVATAPFLFALLGISDEAQSRGHETRLGQVMRAIGWEKKQRRIPDGNGAREYYYLRAGANAEVPQDVGPGMALDNGDPNESAPSEGDTEKTEAIAEVSQPSQPVFGVSMPVGGKHEHGSREHTTISDPSYTRGKDQVMTVVTPQQSDVISGCYPVTTSAHVGCDGVVTPSGAPSNGEQLHRRDLLAEHLRFAQAALTETLETIEARKRHDLGFRDLREKLAEQQAALAAAKLAVKAHEPVSKA